MSRLSSLKSLLFVEVCGGCGGLEGDSFNATGFSDFADSIKKQEAAQTLALGTFVGHSPTQAGLGFGRVEVETAAPYDGILMFHYQVSAVGILEKLSEGFALGGMEKLRSIGIKNG